MRLEFDTKPGAVYMGLREAEKTWDLAELGFGTIGVYGEGKVLGVELLSLRHGPYNPVWRRSLVAARQKEGLVNLSL